MTINLLQPESLSNRVSETPRHKLQAVLTDTESYTTTLLTVLIDRYGTEALGWHPETIRMQLEADFNIKVPPVIIDRIMAGSTLLTTDYFFKSLPHFIDLCNVLSGSLFDPTVFDPADAFECAWGITEAMLLSPPEDNDDEPFVDDIRHYLGFVLRQEGFVRPPDILKLALEADFSDHVRFNFEDDPEMFQAIYQNQSGKATEVTDMIRGNLGELIDQLQSIPLSNGSTDDVVGRARNSLK